MLREDFQAPFARLTGVLQGDVEDQSLALLCFQGDFFFCKQHSHCVIFGMSWNNSSKYKFCFGHDRQIDTPQESHKSTKKKQSSTSSERANRWESTCPPTCPLENPFFVLL